jgi:hypothetical protein
MRKDAQNLRKSFTMNRCPVCKLTANVEYFDAENQLRVDCPACGRFEIPVGVGESLGDHLRPRLGHAIRLRQQTNGDFVSITRDLISRFIEEPLPSPREQMDGILLFIGDRARDQDPVRAVKLSPFEMMQLVSTIGAYDSGSIGLLLTDLSKNEAVEWRPGISDVRILELGWQRYDELKTASPYSRTAFMAMPFGDSVIEKVYREFWRPAVARTGFELRTVTQRAGLIDDHIRVDIRRSRFPISELTGGNHGAYWEAGFAEGLNKRVIYTCEKSYFNNPATKPHFDVNHYSHVIWEQDHLSDAADELVARIRASIPDAKLDD